MNNHGWTLLTGATGFVGQRTLLELLRYGQRVAILVRPSKELTAHERARSIIRMLTAEQSSRVLVIEGDILSPTVVANQQLHDWTHGLCERVVHCAACVSFDADKAPETTNVQGTRNLLQLMRDCEIHELHYVSSAYQCGLRPSEVVLETDLGNPYEKFRNPYEQSKYLAECAVLSSGIHNKTIYRPSIVVGDSRTGETRQYLTFYHLLRIAAGVSLRGAKDIALRVQLVGDEPLNLVPVDWVATAIAKIVDNPEHQNTAYHLSLTTAFTAQEIAEVIAGYFGYKSVKFVGPGNLSDPNILERSFPALLADYHAYYGTDAYFDTTNADSVLGTCEVDEGFLVRLIDYAVHTDFGRKCIAA